MTGDVESFLLYKEMDRFPRNDELDTSAGMDDETDGNAAAASEWGGG